MPVDYIDSGVVKRNPKAKSIVSVLEETYDLDDTGKGNPHDSFGIRFWGLHRLSESNDTARIVRGKRIR